MQRKIKSYQFHIIKSKKIYNSFFFHYINYNNVTYLCMTDSIFSKKTAFDYLNEIKEFFNE